MHHRIHFARHEDEIRDIVADEGELGMARKMGQIFRPAGDKIIHTDDFMPFGNQTITQMRTKKTSRASD
mgnify:CR=1 FL=1